MMKILIAPDSFKGSLTAMEVGMTIKRAFQAVLPESKIEVIAMADGGEGTLEALIAGMQGKIVEIEATGPLGERSLTAYGILGDRKTIVLETAKIAGLTMVPEHRRNPLWTTTYGLGEVILHALNKGYTKFIVGLGGSATNDGGLGMLKALGVSFLDANGNHVEPSAGSLTRISKVDFQTLHPKLRECELRIASDVQNPLCGEQGASFVYGQQKGATPAQIETLDKALHNYANLIEKTLGKRFQYQKGAGAAGGLGFAFLTLGAKMESGSQIISDVTGLENKIKKADWVITGEGQSDFQTLYGKAPFYVAKIAHKYKVKTILISGSLGEGFEQLYDHFISCHSIIRKPASLEDAICHAEQYLSQTAENIARLIKASYYNK